MNFKKTFLPPTKKASKKEALDILSFSYFLLNVSLSNIKLNPLRQWQGSAVIDRIGLTAHIGLPGI